jgi:putative ABC transport system permease protein
MGETLVLGLTGGATGLVLAWALVRVFVTQAPASFPRLAAIDLDLPVLLFSFAVAVVAAALAGLAPAVNLVRVELNAAVQSGSGRAVTAHRARRASRLLVVSEVALALALVTTAGLMTRSLLRLQSQDLGVTREPVLTFSVGLPPFVADGNAAVLRFHQQFAERVRALPGVSHVSAINMLPVAATGNNGRARRDDQHGDDEGVPVTEMRIVMSGYFQAMGVRLLAGRAIEDRDRAGRPAVAVVNETLASRLWPGLATRQIIGRRVRIGFDPSDAVREVIGVVDNVRSRRPDAPPDPELYVPFAEIPSPTMSYVVRSAGDPSALTGAIRSELVAMTPHVALAAVRTFDDVVSTATRTSGLLSWLSVLFGALAATLAILGIYSVMSYTVAQRERELAIRAALGASRTTLLALVMREGLVLSAAGLVAGAVLAWTGSGMLRALLFETSATDPWVFAGAAAMLALAAGAGYLLPATRASRVAPVTALRSE